MRDALLQLAIHFENLPMRLVQRFERLGQFSVGVFQLAHQGFVVLLENIRFIVRGAAGIRSRTRPC